MKTAPYAQGAGASGGSCSCSEGERVTSPSCGSGGDRTWRVNGFWFLYSNAGCASCQTCLAGEFVSKPCDGRRVPCAVLASTSLGLSAVATRPPTLSGTPASSALSPRQMRRRVRQGISSLDPNVKGTDLRTRVCARRVLRAPRVSIRRGHRATALARRTPPGASRAPGARRASTCLAPCAQGTAATTRKQAQRARAVQRDSRPSARSVTEIAQRT